MNGLWTLAELGRKGQTGLQTIMVIMGWLLCMSLEEGANKDRASIWAGLSKTLQRSSLLHPALQSTAWETCVTQPSSQLLVLWKGEPTHLCSGKNLSLLCCINTKANNQTSKQDPACLTFNPGWKQQCPDSSTGTEPHVLEI